LTGPHKYNHIYLIGFMASGKSFLGESLASMMDLTYMDTDQLIEKQTGLTISTLFKEKGEKAFRNLESEVILKLTKEKGPLLIATGGGLPCYNDNMSLINASGFSVYLKWPASILIERLEKSENRPLISRNEEDLTSYVEKLLVVRSEYYENASLVVDSPTIEKLEVLILDKLKSLNR
jgi:shikimate kinase